MKVILSRKGFDSSWGGYASPILPDGRMFSLPIPRPDSISYSNLKFETNKTYYDLMKGLKLKGLKPTIKVKEKYYDLIGKKKSRQKWTILTQDTQCHLDPDIYRNVMDRPKEWKPLFGQIGAAQTHLDNQEVKEGDVFLFFGWFKKTKNCNGKIKFDPKESKSGKHVIFGYLQIGKILKVGPTTNVPSWMNHHPHTSKYYRTRSEGNNTIYIPREALSWDNSLPGAGNFNYSQDLILTKEGYSRSKWELPNFFRNVIISWHNENNWRDDYFQSVARGQEFVIKNYYKVENWVKDLIERNPIFYKEKN